MGPVQAPVAQGLEARRASGVPPVASGASRFG